MENVENFAQELPVVGDKETIDFIQMKQVLIEQLLRKCWIQKQTFLFF